MDYFEDFESELPPEEVPIYPVATINLEVADLDPFSSGGLPRVILVKERGTDGAGLYATYNGFPPNLQAGDLVECWYDDNDTIMRVSGASGESGVVAYKYVNLLDTPETITADWIVKGNATGTALEFLDPSDLSEGGHRDHSEYQSQFNTATGGGDPGSGRIAINAINPSVATEMYISELDRDGEDRSWMLDQIVAGTRITIMNEAYGSKGMVFTANGAPTDNGTWRTIEITYLYHSDYFNNLENVIFGLDFGGSGSGGGLTEDTWDLQYKFNPSTGGGDPGNGYVALNATWNGTPTELQISRYDTNGIDKRYVLAALRDVGYITLLRDDRESARVYQINDAAGYWDSSYYRIPVTQITGFGLTASPSLDDLILVGVNVGSRYRNRSDENSYKFDTTILSGDNQAPGDGNIAFNNAVPADVTRLYVSKYHYSYTGSLQERAWLLSPIDTSTQIRTVQTYGGTSHNYSVVSTPAEYARHYEIDVVYSDGLGSLYANAEQIQFGVDLASSGGTLKNGWLWKESSVYDFSIDIVGTPLTQNGYTNTGLSFTCPISTLSENELLVLQPRVSALIYSTVNAVYLATKFQWKVTGSGGTAYAEINKIDQRINGTNAQGLGISIGAKATFDYADIGAGPYTITLEANSNQANTHFYCRASTGADKEFAYIDCERWSPALSGVGRVSTGDFVWKETQKYVRATDISTTVTQPTYATLESLSIEANAGDRIKIIGTVMAVSIGPTSGQSVSLWGRLIVNGGTPITLSSNYLSIASNTQQKIIRPTLSINEEFVAVEGSNTVRLEWANQYSGMTSYIRASSFPDIEASRINLERHIPFVVPILSPDPQPSRLLAYDSTRESFYEQVTDWSGSQKSGGSWQDTGFSWPINLSLEENEQLEVVINSAVLSYPYITLARSGGKWRVQINGVNRGLGGDYVSGASSTFRGSQGGASGKVIFKYSEIGAGPYTARLFHSASDNWTAYCRPGSQAAEAFESLSRVLTPIQSQIVEAGVTVQQYNDLLARIEALENP